MILTTPSDAAPTICRKRLCEPIDREAEPLLPETAELLSREGFSSMKLVRTDTSMIQCVDGNAVLVTLPLAQHHRATTLKVLREEKLNEEKLNVEREPIASTLDAAPMALTVQEL